MVMILVAALGMVGVGYGLLGFGVVNRFITQIAKPPIQ